MITLKKIKELKRVPCTLYPNQKTNAQRINAVIKDYEKMGYKLLSQEKNGSSLTLEFIKPNHIQKHEFYLSFFTNTEQIKNRIMQKGFTINTVEKKGLKLIILTEETYTCIDVWLHAEYLEQEKIEGVFIARSKNYAFEFEFKGEMRTLWGDNLTADMIKDNVIISKNGYRYVLKGLKNE